MMIKQNDLEMIKDKVDLGQLTTEQANVELVQIARVRLITGKIPLQVRNALNLAVKKGELGHLKKEGHKPEAYFHPKFDYLARSQRAKHEREVLNCKFNVLFGK